MKRDTKTWAMAFIVTLESLFLILSDNLFLAIMGLLSIQVAAIYVVKKNSQKKEKEKEAVAKLITFLTLLLSEGFDNEVKTLQNHLQNLETKQSAKKWIIIFEELTDYIYFYLLSSDKERIKHKNTLLNLLQLTNTQIICVKGD